MMRIARLFFTAMVSLVCVLGVGAQSDGWEVEVAPAHDHGDHAPGPHEEHDDGGHEEHEPGVVHLTEKSIENFGIKTQIIEPCDLTLTLDLYGWVRPRPQDVKVIRAPFPAILTEVFVWPGQFVGVNDPLLSYIVPEELDWTETVLSSENEFRRLSRLDGLLRAEGHAKAVELIGELQVAAAELKKLQAELSRLEQAGTGAISKRETEVKKGEVEAARAKVRAKRGLAQTYGFDPARIQAYESGEEMGPNPDGAMPTEIRSRLEVIEFSRRKSTISGQVAEGRLKILGVTDKRIQELKEEGGGLLENTLIVRSEIEGLITEVLVTSPSPVDPDDEIMRLVDYRKVYVEIEVPEVYIGNVLKRAGDDIDVQVEGIGASLLKGKVVYFDTKVLAKERMAHLVLEVENVDGMTLRDGMAMMAGVPLEKRSDVLSVPRSSLIDDGMEKVLFVEEANGDFRREPVLVGVTTLSSVEILEGLKPGQRVAVAGTRPLLLAIQKKEGRSEAGGHGHGH